ncbi:MAG: aminopeptidase P family protein [Bdellovibrionota bacterium]
MSAHETPYFNRAVLEDRAQRLIQSFSNHLGSDDVVVICSGEPIQKPGGLDQSYPFLTHPDFYWLSGLQRPESLFLYSKTEGLQLFIKKTSRDEQVWEGLNTQFEGRDVNEFESFFSKKKYRNIYVLGQANSRMKSLENVSVEKHDEIQEALNKVRRVKDDAEIALVKKAFQAAHAGYMQIRKIIRPGITERQLQLEYEFAALNAGAEKFPYDTLVGSGTNASILHAIPSSRVLNKGEIVVIDAGADIQDYCVDITRVFAVDGTFTSKQKDIYDLVLKSQIAALELCRPSVSWSEVHLTAARVLAQGLIELKIAKGSTEALVESGAISVFFPHGVGHMVGLRVRDVGGVPKPKAKLYAGVRIRVDIPLEENFLMTVEPGLYFIKALIEDSNLQVKYKEHINWSEVEKWKDFGGVRIEDNVLIKASGNDVITSAVTK